MAPSTGLDVVAGVKARVSQRIVIGTKKNTKSANTKYGQVSDDSSYLYSKAMGVVFVQFLKTR